MTLLPYHTTEAFFEKLFFEVVDGVAARGESFASRIVTMRLHAWPSP